MSDDQLSLVPFVGGGPLEGTTQDRVVAPEVEVAVNGCTDDRMVCHARYRLLGDAESGFRYQYLGHCSCGPTVQEHVARTAEFMFRDMEHLDSEEVEDHHPEVYDRFLERRPMLDSDMDRFEDSDG